MTRVFLLLLFLSLPGGLAAHSAVQGTVPADGAVLADAPKTVELRFAKPARLTRVTLAGTGLDLPAQNGFANDFVVDLPPVSAGKQTVEWRALSVDGHPVSGTFSFTVD